MKQMHSTPVCGVIYIKMIGKFSPLHLIHYIVILVCAYDYYDVGFKNNFECRWDTSKAETYYNQELARTITSMKTCACLSKSQPAAKRLGVKHSPLIDISLEHVIVDELHLFLRITDILLRNVIQHVIEEDLRTTRKADLLNGPRLKMLVKCIRKCGISFCVWCTQEGEGSKLDWTSLMGPDKRKLLEKLPAYFNDILPSATDLTTKLWRVSTDDYYNAGDHHSNVLLSNIGFSKPLSENIDLEYPSN